MRNQIAEIICKDCACNGVEGCILIVDHKSGKDCLAALSTADHIIALFDDTINQCLTENDSETHLLAKDLREKWGI